jgi:hypothetical protein
MKYKIEILDVTGRKIPSKVIDDLSWDRDTIVVKVNTDLVVFPQSQWMTLLHLLAKAIDYGGEVEEIRNYIELFDKIKKIVDQNDCK